MNGSGWPSWTGFGSMPQGAFGVPSGGGLSGGTTGGALPSTTSSYPWLSNYLQGFGIPSTVGQNGLPQIGLPNSSAPQSQLQSSTPSQQPLSNPMGQLGGGFGIPFWMQMLRQGMPQVNPITSGNPTASTLPGQALQNKPPTVTAPAPPAPAPPVGGGATSWAGTPIGPTQQAQLQQFSQQNPAYNGFSPQQLYNMMTYGNIQGDQNQAFQGR